LIRVNRVFAILFREQGKHWKSGIFKLDHRVPAGQNQARRGGGIPLIEGE
jgi:hypothetical protein